MSSDDVASDRVSTEILEKLISTVDVSDLRAWAEQPLDYDVGLATVRDGVFGKLGLPVVWEGEVLIGSQIVDAEKIDPKDGGRVMVIDLTPLGWPRHKALAAALGELTAQRTAYWDDKLLAELVTSLHEQDAALLSQSGWGGDEIQELLDRIEADEAGVFDGDALGDLDDVAPVPPTNPVTKSGDIWHLGPHRLLCGDCRRPEDVAKVLDGAQINLAFTSPPYADRRTYDESSGFKPIPPDEYVAWFEPVAANVAAHLAGGGSWFVNIKAASNGLDTETYVLDLVLAHVGWGWHWAGEFCWERPGLPQEPQRRFKNQYEPIYQFTHGEWKFRPDAVRVESRSAITYDPARNMVGEREQGDTSGSQSFTATQVGAGLAYPGNRLPTFSGSHEATGHSAAFPVGLPDFFVRAYTDEGDTVFDPFMGSGSTLLAAHQNGRIGYGIEISPAYCDVILARWQRVVGEQPTRDGVPYDFGAA
jgi:site-specific DNA-methyltransferase (adenine-specific)/site-specific DNA-methyltransferase (cytosine-N4-specific)